MILKIAIIGFGWFGKKHFEVWNELEGVEVVAICDINIHNAINSKSVQSNFHTNDHNKKINLSHINIYSDINELIEKETFDVLDIVVDEEQHYPIAKIALNHNKNIIVEKPFVTQYKHAVELQEIAKKNNLRIFVCNILRFDLRMRYIKERIINNELGELKYLSFKRNFQPIGHSVYGRIHPFFASMIHDIDLAIWFTSLKVKSHSSQVKSLLKRKNPDVLISVLEFDNDLLCTIENIWHINESCPYGFESEETIYGENETIRVKNQPNIEVWNKDKVEYPELFFWPRVMNETQGALKSMLSHYRDCLLENKDSNILPLTDVIYVIKLAEDLLNDS